MTTDQRLRQLEENVGTMSRALHISVMRLEWMLEQTKRDASPDDLAGLERVEELAILDCVEHGSPTDALVAKEALARRGLVVPDVIPIDLAA